MTAGGAVPGAAEVAAIRARWGYDYTVDEAKTPLLDTAAFNSTARLAGQDIAALLTLTDALTGALARAVGGERWAEPVYAPGALVQVASWRCRFCGGRASPQEHIAHTANCPVWILAQARGGRDGGE